MQIWILTLFPGFINSFIDLGVVGKGLRGERGQYIKLHALNIRDFAGNKYKGVDDAPFGGGPGVIIRADVLKRALFDGVWAQYVDSTTADFSDLKKLRQKLLVICTTPRGKVWQQKYAERLAQEISAGVARDLVIICGRYEGIDERFIEKYVEEEWSVGDFILSGGELAALTTVDSILRLLPGFLGNHQALQEESFTKGSLEAPQYTRPRDFEGMPVPPVLTSGDHQKILDYKNQQRLLLTQKYRPDLLN